MKSSVEILGVPIHAVSKKEVAQYVETLFKKKKQSYLVTVNPEMLLESQENEDFFKLLKSSGLNTADGMGVVWAAYYLSLPISRYLIIRSYQLIKSLLMILINPSKVKSVIKERVTGSDLLPYLIEEGQEKGWKFFFLGAEKGVAQRAIKNLSKKYPKVQFAGSYSGDPSVESEEEIVDLISKSGANLLMVAYGSPSQEFWIRRNLFKIQKVRLAVGVGGTFDFYAKKIKRAPSVFRQLGLEWVWRLMMEPSRASRIWRATVEFIRLIHKEKLNTKNT